ncbi:hypothetical protein K3495_g1945 [Podosphaera aphanis]|nr:hypothetical protein K3495_g1945 [Podosphaera aphanis]
MAHKDRQSETSERSAERRLRPKTDKDSERSHKSRSTKPKVTDSESGKSVKLRRRKKEDSEDKVKKRISEPNLLRADLVPELSRAPSRISLPYPSFNKNYSKEAVRIDRENLKLSAEKTPITPESTDLGSDKKLRSKPVEQQDTESKHGRPPSPPETDVSKKKIGQRKVSQVQECLVEEEKVASKISLVSKASKREGASKSTEDSKTSEVSELTESSLTSEDSSENTVLRSETGSKDGSNATSVPPKRTRSVEEKNHQPYVETVPIKEQDFTPSVKPIPSPFIHLKTAGLCHSEKDSAQHTSAQAPSNLPTNTPCVDYLIENGGLLRPVPKKIFEFAHSTSQHQQAISTPIKIGKIFAPCLSILDEYETVLKKNGSLAVATGYRSVARRLLDRLEVVMGRDLDVEGCLCVMCRHASLASYKNRKELGWGEVLEWSAGRKELPVWPAFDFATLGVKAAELAGIGLSQKDTSSSASPIKVDPDISDEFREYYLQQSKKTKLAVDRWLSSCPETAATPPQEIDDETLSFAILTHLDQKERPIFHALNTGSTVLQPISRIKNSPRKPRSDFVMRTAQSIQRLYKLSLPPRDPEVAIFLLQNPELHDLLATISKISSREWEILTSGRFDGFLWSGADTESSRSLNTPNVAPQRSELRNSDPSLSINSGKSFHGQSIYPQTRRPVLNDEETEIGVLAEVEREIYQGMEALEDAFENLHRKAELVRRALRERATGITLSLQSRQLSEPSLDILDSPLSGVSSMYGRQCWGDRSESHYTSDWDPGDDYSELAPDDSASNISSSRHRRPKRRNERMAPTLLEEEDEE